MYILELVLVNISYQIFIPKRFQIINFVPLMSIFTTIRNGDVMVVSSGGIG